MPTEQQLQQFRFLAGVAMVDGRLDAAETGVLMKAAGELTIAADQAQAILRELQEGAAAALKVPTHPGERAKLFRSLVDLVAADGEIDRSELAFFQKIAPRFHLSELEVEDILHAASKAAQEEKRKTSRRQKVVEPPAEGGSPMKLVAPPPNKPTS